MCWELGTSVGLVVLWVWGNEWRNDKVCAWHQKYMFTGGCLFALSYITAKKAFFFSRWISCSTSLLLPVTIIGSKLLKKTRASSLLDSYPVVLLALIATPSIALQYMCQSSQTTVHFNLFLSFLCHFIKAMCANIVLNKTILCAWQLGLTYMLSSKTILDTVDG